MWNESFFSAPQLKRDPLGGRDHRIPNQSRTALIPHTINDWLAEGLLIVGGGAGLAYYSWSVVEGWAAKRWPVTIGVVTAANMRVSPSRLGNSYDPCISYSFTVEGTPYTGARRCFGDTYYAFKGPAESRLARYAVGSSVEVHYHPVDPSRSVLEVGTKPSTYFALLFFGGLLVMGIGFMLGILH